MIAAAMLLLALQATGGLSTRVDPRTGALLGSASSPRAQQVYAPAPRTEAPRNSHAGIEYSVNEEVDEGTEQFTPRPRPPVYYDPRILQSLRDGGGSPRVAPNTPAPPPPSQPSGDLLQRQGPQLFLPQDGVSQQPQQPPQQPVRSAFPQTPPFFYQNRAFLRPVQTPQDTPVDPQGPPPVYQQQDLPPQQPQVYQTFPLQNPPVYQPYPQAAFPQQPPPPVLLRNQQQHNQHNQQQNQQQQQQQQNIRQDDNYRRGYNKKGFRSHEDRKEWGRHKEAHYGLEDPRLKAGFQNFLRFFGDFSSAKYGSLQGGGFLGAGPGMGLAHGPYGMPLYAPTFPDLSLQPQHNHLHPL